MVEENGSADRPVHVRTSEHLLNNDIVYAFAELDGHGLSYMDSLVAMKVVANRVFKQNWKLPKEKDRLSKYDQYDDGEALSVTMVLNWLPRTIILTLCRQEKQYETI